MKDLLDEYYVDREWCGGTKRFDGVPVDVIEALIEEGDADPEDNQNSSPSIGEFVEFGRNFQEEHGYPVTFHGYRVSPERTDKRVSLEGFSVHHALTVPALLSILEIGRMADEFEVDANNAYAWWD